MRRIAIVLLCLIPNLAVAEPMRRLTLQQAMTEALSTSPAMVAAQAHSDAQEDAAHAVRGRMLPRVRLTDEQLRYREPWDLSIMGAALRARDANVNVFGASVEQPVLGLMSLSSEKAAMDHAADAAAKKVRVTEADVRKELQLGFLSLFEARALVDAAHVSVEQLSEQTRVTQSKLGAGVALSGELLRVKVALANAQQQEIQARAKEQVARARLLEVIGRRPDEPSIDFEEPTELEQPDRGATSLSRLIDQAIEHRPDLQAARLRLQAERSHASGRKWDLLPEVSLVGAYAHVKGEVLAPTDSSYVGVRVGWTVWDWGTKYYESAAASHNADAAQADEQALLRRIATEVAGCAAELDAANHAVTLATEAIVSAEEAYRVTDAQLRAGTATVTDVLDAQSALTQVRLNLVRARYARAMANVLLAHATGT